MQEISSSGNLSSSNQRTNEEAAPHSSAWKWPWILMLVGLYIFGLPWIADAILGRYWITQDYDAVLVGLDKTTARKFTMVGHMSFGALCLLLGPFQFLPVIRRKWPMVHRWMGRVYVCSSLICSLLGFIFIILKRFILVGGINMGIAFSVAGLTFAISSALTAYYARCRCWTQHRDWSIRAYSQILSPMLYRYFYLILGGLQLYPANEALDCDNRDVCKPFTNTFDAIHAWTYFLVPLAFAELIIRCLPAIKDEDLRLQQEDEVETGQANEVKAEDTENTQYSFRRLNLLGVVGAAFSVLASAVIYATSIAGVNTVSA